MKVIKPILLCVLLSLVLIFGGCSSNKTKATNSDDVQKLNNQVSELNKSQAELENKNTQLEQQFQLADSERKEYRKDVEAVLSLLESGELGLTTPVFSGFTTDTEKAHISIIKQYISDYTKKVTEDEEITKEIKPLVKFLLVQPITDDELVLTKTEGTSYYKVVFYTSTVPASQYKDFNANRGPFDGLVSYFVLQIEKKDGKWQVKDFGPNS